MRGISHPSTWIAKTLKEIVAHFESGKRPKGGVATYTHGVISLGAEHLRANGSISTENPKFVPHEFAKGLERVRVLVDDILIVKDGATTGKTSLATATHEGAVINEHLFQLRPTEAVDARYLFYFLWSSPGNAEIMKDFRGSAQGGITKSVLDVCEVLVAPLNEQRRIVEKIETMFALLDKGEEALRDVQKLLARYRQSVLKAAVTGQLTADWRAQNTHPLEHGRDLLARILQTRRETWDGRGIYKEPAPPNTTDLPELPEGWVWTSLGALISKGPQNGLYLPQSKYGSGTPILRIDDYQVDWIRPVSELRQVAAEPDDCQKYGLQHGDFVVNRVNSVSHLGKTTLLLEEYAGAVFESNMMRFSASDRISKEYLGLYLTSDLGRERLIKNCKHAVNQASINQGDVEATPVPLPPRLEQEEIVQTVSEDSSREIAVLATCKTELARSASLRQSILKDAFAGRLVPQDPTDEPATALLARIKETRAAAPGRIRRKARV